MTRRIETVAPARRLEKRLPVQARVAGTCLQAGQWIFCSSIHLRGGDIARNQALEQIQG